MKHTALAGVAALLIAGAAQAETLKMATIEPSLGPAIVMSTFANIVTDALPDTEIEVAGGGAATLHMLEVARGNLDMSMVSPSIYPLMQNGKAMYANEPEAPEPSTEPSSVVPAAAPTTPSARAATRARPRRRSRRRTTWRPRASSA